MKNKCKEVLNILLGLIIIVVIIYVSLIVIMKFIDFMITVISIMSNYDAVILVALLTGFLSILGIIISKFLEYRQKKQLYLYEKKEKAYASFIKMVYKMQECIKKGEDYSDKDMLEDVLNFSKELTLWGSNKVIKKWIEFRNTDYSNPEDYNYVLYNLEDIIIEIRKDMGHKKFGLNKGDILSFFINDKMDDKSIN